MQLSLPHVEDELNFNAHLSARTCPRTGEPLTRETIEALVGSLGIAFEFDEDSSFFKGDNFLWRANITDPVTTEEWWLYVQSSDVLPKAVEVEMRWCTNLEDSSDGFTFAHVVAMYASAKKTVQRLHALVSEGIEPCFVHDETTINVHVQSTTGILKALPTRAQLEDCARGLGLLIDVDETDTSFDDDGFVWNASVTKPQSPFYNQVDFGHWWLWISSLDDKSVKVEMRFLNDINDTTTGYTFKEVKRLYGFGKLVVQRMHMAICSL